MPNILNHEDIRIGTLVQAGAGHDPAGYIRQILPHGFESFSLTFWQTLGGVDLQKISEQIKEVLAGSGAIISSVGIYGNPLGQKEIDAETRKGWETLIESAPNFGCDVVCGFAGRVVDEPIPNSMTRYAEIFGPLAKRGADHGVRLAFENCSMGGTWPRGDWNIAHHPDAWEMMFEALPAENVGLQWEPCHQMIALIDPMPQLRKWLPKIFNVHGKDATVLWDVVRESGVFGPKPFAFHRTPGFGDSNWTDIISELRRGGFKGSIDIEGWHDPVYRDELEMTGRVHGLNYLKRCRGGAFVPNPR